MAIKRKKNYGSGSNRGELVRLMLGFGIVTSHGLTVLDGELKFKQRTLSKMKKEGLCGSTAVRLGGNATYLIDVAGDNGDEYLDEMPVGYYGEYNSVGRVVVKRVQKKGLKYDTERKRTIRQNEVQLFFYGSSIPILPDEKPVIEDIDKTNRPIAYYSSIEIKRQQLSEEIIASPSNAPASRMLGIYSTPSRIYSVFKTEDKLIKVMPGVEFTAMMSVKEQFYAPDNEMRLLTDAKWDSILIYENDDAIKKAMGYRANDTQHDTKSDNFSFLDYSNQTYRNIYAFPYIKDSQPILGIMAKDNWEEEIVLSVLPEGYEIDYSDDVTNIISKQDVVINGVNQTRNIYGHVFCVPDIRRLRQFLEVAHRADSKSIFQLFFFPWQRSLVEKIVTSPMVELVEVEDIYKREDKPKSRTGVKGGGTADV